MAKTSQGTALGSQHLILTERISLKEKIFYTMGDMGSNLFWAPISTFLVFFYTDIAGIAAGIAGTILFVVRMLDAFTDVAMGYIVDRTKTKYGKARPWLLWVAIPIALSFVLLFTAPNFSMPGKIAYAFVTYFIMTAVLFTMLIQPYNTLNALITQDQYDRSILAVMRMAGGVIIALIVNNITLPLVDSLGGDPRAWQLMAAIYGTVAVIFILLCFRGTKEKVTPVKEEKIPLQVGLKSLFANKYWIMMLFVGVLVFILMSLPGANIYYAQYFLGDAAYLGPIMTCNFIPNLIGFFLLPLLIRRIGKRNGVFIGFALYLLGTIVMAFNPFSVTYILVGTTIKSFGFVPILGTLFAFIADTIEYGEWKTGFRTEGLNYSAASFGQKFGSALGGAIIGWLLSWGGYVANAATQSALTMSVIKFLFIYTPLIVYCLIAIIMIFYKLDAEYPMILAELNRRKQSLNA